MRNRKYFSIKEAFKCYIITDADTADAVEGGRVRPAKMLPLLISRMGRIGGLGPRAKFEVKSIMELTKISDISNSLHYVIEQKKPSVQVLHQLTYYLNTTK